MNTLKTTALALTAAGFAGQASAALFITEYMADPTTSEPDNEYFEVFNDGAPISVATLTISDDDSDSVSFTDSTSVIGTNEFFVFGGSSLSYVDEVYSGFALANGGDEIVVSQGGTVLARVTYSDGDDFGDGVANVLANISSGSATIGPDGGSDYIAETADNDVLPGDDIGSPGVAGSTVVPEPASLALVGLGGLAILGRRRSA